MQSRMDSLIEAVVNTFIGWFVFLLAWLVIAWAYSVPMTWAKNIQITLWFTLVSLLRQFILRRLFNGRSVWMAIRGQH